MKCTTHPNLAAANGGACPLCQPRVAAGILGELDPEHLRGELARRDFATFVRTFWPIVEPAHPLKWGWHLDAISEHLEAFARSQIRRLVINQPPGTGKSLLASVLMPAWIWTWRPTWRGLFASYSDKLARRDSGRTRTLVVSPKYRALYGLELDDDREDDFSISGHMGRRLATSVGGRSTGFRVHSTVIDDPISATDAFSDAARESAIRWLTQALPSRLDDVENAGQLIVMQRLHERDPSGYVLAADLGYEHLCLPAEYDPRRSTVTSLGAYDRRTEPGELLCPAIHSAGFLAERKKELGPYGYAGQYDQAPTPLDGGVIKTSAWRFFREDGDPAIQPRPVGAWAGDAAQLPPRLSISITVDLGMKGGKENDNTAMIVLGQDGADTYVLDVVARPMEFTEQITALLALRRRWPDARRILVEDSANYAALSSELKRKISGIVPVRADAPKEARIMAMTPAIESGNVYLRDGAPWVDDVIAEASAFPRGRRDDRLDALAQGIANAASTGGYLRGFAAGEAKRRDAQVARTAEVARVATSDRDRAAAALARLERESGVDAERLSQTRTIAAGGSIGRDRTGWSLWLLDRERHAAG